MVTSISATGPVSGTPTRPDTQDLFKRLDSKGKGYLTQDDLASAVVKISAQGAELSQDAANAKAQKILRRLDTNRDGKITQGEFTKGSEQGPEALASPGADPAGGAERPKGGAAKGAKPAASGREAATAGSGPIYSPADANRDGTVTVPEAYAYETQQAPPPKKGGTPASSPSTSSTSTAPSAAARSAVQAYRIVEQLAAA
jgi:hypothetical protein